MQKKKTGKVNTIHTIFINITQSKTNNNKYYERYKRNIHPSFKRD